MQYCTSCGNQIGELDAFCSKCGHAKQNLTPQPVTYTPTPSEQPKTSSNSGLGASITGVIFGALSIYFLLTDFSQLGSGWFTSVAPGEIGLLATLSTISIIFGGIGTSKKHTLGYLALTSGVIAIVLTAVLAQYLP